MNRAIYLIAAILLIVPCLMGDMILMKNGQKYEGIIFSQDDAGIVKVMLENGTPVYLSRKHIETVSLFTSTNKKELVEIARLKDTLRIRDREFIIMKELKEHLEKECNKLKAELEMLKTSGGSTYTPPAQTAFLKLITYETKFSFDTLKISGIIQNEGQKTSRSAEILVTLYDEEGNTIESLRLNVLKEGEELSEGAVTEFDLSEKVGHQTIKKLTSIKVTPVNEDD